MSANGEGIEFSLELNTADFNRGAQDVQRQGGRAEDALDLLDRAARQAAASTAQMGQVAQATAAMAARMGLEAQDTARETKALAGASAATTREVTALGTASSKTAHGMDAAAREALEFAMSARVGRGATDQLGQAMVALTGQIAAQGEALARAQAGMDRFGDEAAQAMRQVRQEAAQAQKVVGNTRTWTSWLTPLHDGLGTLRMGFGMLRQAVTQVWGVLNPIPEQIQALSALASPAGLTRAAADYQELSGAFRQVFKESQVISDTTRWIDEFGSSVGRGKVQLTGMVTNLQQILMPMVGVRDEAAAMSRRLATLAVDLSAFTNRAEADVLRDLTSALAGQTETMMKYGVVLTETNLKRELARLGYKGDINAADDATKAQARYNLILANTADAHGQALREAEGFNGQMKSLTSVLGDVAAELGGRMIEALGRVMHGMGGAQGIVDRLRPAMESLADASIKMVSALADGLPTFARWVGYAADLASFFARHGESLATLTAIAGGLVAGKAVAGAGAAIGGAVGLGAGATAAEAGAAGAAGGWASGAAGAAVTATTVGAAGLGAAFTAGAWLATQRQIAQAEEAKAQAIRAQAEAARQLLGVHRDLDNKLEDAVEALAIHHSYYESFKALGAEMTQEWQRQRDILFDNVNATALWRDQARGVKEELDEAARASREWTPAARMEDGVIWVESARLFKREMEEIPVIAADLELRLKSLGLTGSGAALATETGFNRVGLKTESLQRIMEDLQGRLALVGTAGAQAGGAAASGVLAIGQAAAASRAEVEALNAVLLGILPNGRGLYENQYRGPRSAYGTNPGMNRTGNLNPGAGFVGYNVAGQSPAGGASANVYPASDALGGYDPLSFTRGFAGGGTVPEGWGGRGGADEWNARLNGGEFVVPKRPATRHRAALMAMTSGAAAQADPAPVSGGNGSVTLNLHSTGMTDEDLERKLFRVAERMRRRGAAGRGGSYPAPTW